MAEGGGGSGSNEENTFSFKKYVNKQTETTTDNTSSVENEDEVGNADGTSNVAPDVGVVTTSTSGNANEQTSRQVPIQRQRRAADSFKSKRSRNDENAMSFKKFLQNSNPGTAVHSRTTFDLTNDLPDFVQQCSSKVGNDDHWSPGELSTSRTHDGASLPDFALHTNVARPLDGFIHHVDSPLPDFTRQLDSCASSQHPLGQPECLSPPNPDAQHALLPDFALQLNGVNHQSIPPTVQPSDGVVSSSQGGALPDFLSYNVVSTSACRIGNQSDASTAANSSNGDCVQQLIQLQEEKAQLRAELLSARQLVGEKSNTMEALHAELKTVRQRETEEMAAMVAMVQQVETNLGTTMKRASSAESRVRELEHELKVTKASLASLQAGHTSTHLQTGDAVQQRVQLAADQLTTAARQADSTIQQLSSGVELIREVSRMLASLATSSDPTQQQPQPGTSGS